MRRSHVMMLGGALICATAAALFTRAWLVSQSTQQPSKTEAAAPAPSRSIVVTTGEFNYGDKLTAESVKLVPWAGDTLPRGAFLSKEALFPSGDPRVVLHAMTEGEPVLLHKLLGGASSNALSAKLGEDMKAVTIRVNEVAGMAGLVQPNDRVDVLLTYTEASESEKPGAANSSIVVLMQNVRVLAVDQATQRQNTANPPKAVTLEVATDDAQRLVLGARIGELSLMLNGVASTGGDQPTRTISKGDLLRAEQRLQGAADRGPNVVVTRSTERKSYAVPEDQRPEAIWRHEILQQEGIPALPEN